MDEENLPEETEENESSEEQGKGVSSDLIRGHINTIILRALYDGDKYGYEIISEIERKSHGQYTLKQPSLYSALKRLEKDGYITSYWGGSVGGGRRKYFSLTDAGKEIAEQNQSEWEYSRTIIDSLISDKDFDFNNPAPSAVNMRVLRRTTSRVPAGEDEGEFEFEPVFDDAAERERLNAEYNQKNGELEAQRISLEEERAKFEEEMRAREEALNLKREENEKELAARNQELEEERGYIKAVREQEELERAERDASEAEYALLKEEKEKERAAFEEERILHEQELAEQRKKGEDELETEKHRHEQALLDERRLYEQSLLEANRAREAALEEERKNREFALAEQEKRIREEMEREFKLREKEILRQNYINLVNTPPSPDPDAPYYVSDDEPVPTPPPAPVAPTPAEPESDYRSVLGKVYASAVPRSSSSEAEVERAQSLSGIDFGDIESRAARDGIRVVTAGNRTPQQIVEENTVHKGKAMFLSAVVVFFFCVALGSIVLGIQKKYGTAVFLPYFIWGCGIALLLVTGLAYANKFGEKSLRRKSLALLNSIVIYALLVIVTLIVALAFRINFSNSADLGNFVVIPIVFFFGVVIFGVTYYLQVRELRTK